MAITSNILFRSEKGTIEKAYTCYNLKGQNIIRTKPVSVENPRTPNQVKARAKNLLLQKIYKQLPNTKQMVNLEKKQKHSPLNALQAINSPANVPDGTAPVTGSYEDYANSIVLNYNSLKISKGSLLKPQNASAEVTADNEITISVDGNPNENLNDATDTLHVVAINKNTHEVHESFTSSVSRGTGAPIVEVPITVNGVKMSESGNYLVYVMFTNYYTRKSSDSVYAPNN